LKKPQKVVVVTGASQGIGAAVVREFRKPGCRVVATSRSVKASNDDDIIRIAGDIGDPATAQRLISEGIAPSAVSITGEILHVDGGQSAGR
jgi:NAD(P)-dependent dehydrogenase (short-subunit alcohol dehydrogenase family)